ncbi:hypothetical protein ABW20_dc0101002 [Dactylellina cionopaga]|nr:hypothetical protein ABW20_dc0101002 [Dactylellina cionopaga]
MTAPLHACVRCQLDIGRAVALRLARHQVTGIRRQLPASPKQWVSIRSFSDNVDEDLAMDGAVEKSTLVSYAPNKPRVKFVPLKEKEKAKEDPTSDNKISKSTFVPDRPRVVFVQSKDKDLNRSRHTPKKAFNDEGEEPWATPRAFGYLRSISDLSESHIAQPVKLRGWLLKVIVLSPNLIFAKLLQNAQSIQITFNEDSECKDSSALRNIKPHTPVEIEGVLMWKHNPGSSENPFHVRVEVLLKKIVVIGNPPREPIILDTVYPAEKRYLNMRTNPRLMFALKLRNKVSQVCRKHLDEEGFLEVETPLLFKSTPEGAREFLVPTRTPNLMYALPQSPQQYKQILMAAGVHKYFQIAKCFRDEDLRADRQPEFTQLDMEMAFLSGTDVQRAVERLMKRIWWEVLQIKLPTFPRLKYHDAINNYGSDKPDLRYDMIVRIG